MPRTMTKPRLRASCTHAMAQGRLANMAGVARAPSTYLAAVARLAGPLGVGQPALDRRGEVGGDARLRRACRHAMLDALDLVGELRFVLRGPLRGHGGCNGRRYIPKQTTVGTVGAGWWLDYGARLTLSVEPGTHDVRSWAMLRAQRQTQPETPWHTRGGDCRVLQETCARMNDCAPAPKPARAATPQTSAGVRRTWDVDQGSGHSSAAGSRFIRRRPDRCHVVPDMFGQKGRSTQGCAA